MSGNARGMRPGARLALLACWLLALGGLGALVAWRLQVSTDLRSFMPAPTTPDQRLLMEQVGDGPGSRLLLLATGFGLVAGYAGLVVSYAAGSSLPAGPAIILAAGCLYLLSLLFGSQDGLARRALIRPHLER